MPKFTIKYSYDNGKTIETWGPVTEGYLIFEKATALKQKGAIIYGLFKDGKRI